MRKTKSAPSKTNEDLIGHDLEHLKMSSLTSLKKISKMRMAAVKKMTLMSFGNRAGIL